MTGLLVSLAWYVEHGQAVERKDRLDAEEREVGEVLVIDRVELIVVEELHQMGELERTGPRRLEDDGDAGDERVQIGHLREHVVAQHHVRDSSGGAKLACGSFVEERHHGFHAPLACRLGYVCRGLDAETGNPPFDEVLQEVAVVASELDDEAVLGQRRPLGDHRDVLFGVPQPSGGERGEVCVLRKDFFDSYVLGELHEETVPTYPHVQRVEGLHFVEPVRRQEALAQRRHSEIDDGVSQSSAAEAALDWLHCREASITVGRPQVM